MTNYISKAVESEQIAREHEKLFRFRGLIVGPSKTGKSTLFAATAPGRKLIIDCDNRYHSINYPNTDVLPVFDLASSQSVRPGMTVEEIGAETLVKAWNILIDINNELWTLVRSGKFEYDSICGDTLSSFNRIAMAFVLSLKHKADGEPVSTGIAGAPARHHYGPQMHILSMLLFSLSALPVHFVMNGHTELFEDKKTGETLWLPRMYGKTRYEIGSWYDECYESERTINVATGEQIYNLRTIGYANKQFLGSSMNTEGRYWKSPFRVNLSESPAGIEKLIKLRFGEVAKGGELNASLSQSLGSSAPSRVVLQPGGSPVGNNPASHDIRSAPTDSGKPPNFRPGIGSRDAKEHSPSK